MAGAKICEFGKKIKKRLVDIGESQEWLIEQVRVDTGLYFDRSYLLKIMKEQSSAPKIRTSIEKILEISDGNNAS